jgi:hypothetical protein
MSFALTEEQVRNRTKDVTRRLGWWNLKPGEIVNAVVKSMGLKKGEKVKRICQIRIKSTRPERLGLITDDEVAREGFPHWNRFQFIKFFLDKNKRSRISTVVNRIEFEYI